VNADGLHERSRVGLCEHCINVQVIETRRGSRFFRCRLADIDPAFVRYPPLPVISCPGFAPIDEAEPSQGT
jgi:hypothetical protein